jgi:hypothetical protein
LFWPIQTELCAADRPVSVFIAFLFPTRLHWGQPRPTMYPQNVKACSWSSWSRLDRRQTAVTPASSAIILYRTFPPVTCGRSESARTREAITNRVRRFSIAFHDYGDNRQKIDLRKLAFSHARFAVASRVTHVPISVVETVQTKCHRLVHESWDHGSSFVCVYRELEDQNPCRKE